MPKISIARSICRASAIAALGKFCDVGLARTSSRTLRLNFASGSGHQVQRLSFRIAETDGLRCAASVSALHHLALGTQDVARLARFYRDVLELPELTRHLHTDGTLRSVWLDLGGPVLMLEATQEAPRVVIGVGSGPFLIALSVAPALRPAFEARLQAAGSEIESRTEWTSYARDPDGNRIALSSYTLDAGDR